MADTTQLYVVNLDFEGGAHGEIIEAEPALVADWLDADWISPVDERGDRIIDTKRGKPVTDPGATPAGNAAAPRRVTQDDVDAADTTLPTAPGGLDPE